MPTLAHRTTKEPGNVLRSVFADLRKRNEYRYRVARTLEAKRQRRLDRVNRDQPKPRVHQPR